MSKTDDFEKFLKSGFEKNKYIIEDDGFTERVISRLPTYRISLKNRKFILYTSSALSVLIFLVSNGYKSLFLAIIDVFNNGLHWIKPSFNSFFVIIVFISVLFIISRIEHNEDLI